MLLLRWRKKVPVLGFSLIEVLVGIAVFAIIAISIYQAFAAIMEAVRISRLRVLVAAIANEQFEIARNLPYTDVGLVNGLPAGKLLRNQTLVRSGVEFSVIITVRSIDDPFDGLIGGSPNDLSPADYKLVALDISCTNCRGFSPVSFTTYVAPLALETTSDNGALFVRVFDANGQPIQGANVHLENNLESPPIIIDDVTNNDGYLQIVDAPPGVEAYEITVSKLGYSTERTYLSGAPTNPNPTKPHATVVLQQVTQTSLAIDLVSQINLSTVTKTCATVSSIDFDLQGSKLIGSDPDVLKYEESFISDGSGQVNVSDMEWDTYLLSITDGSYDLAGTIPGFPLAIIPGSTQEVKLIMAAKDPNSLLVKILDGSTQLPLSGAAVTLSQGGYTETLVTGRGFLRQTDWSGGGGQDDFIDVSKYFSSDGNIAIANPAGELKLWESDGQYVSAGYLESSTFDTGSVSNFHQILWQPQDQPPSTGENSIKFQIATNNDNSTWNFIGPDGTNGTYYTLADSNINPTHNGDRYFRYKLFLTTLDQDYSPVVSDISFTFTSTCVPPGQVLFTGLSAGEYNLTAALDGYQTVEDTVDVASGWQEKSMIISP